MLSSVLLLLGVGVAPPNDAAQLNDGGDTRATLLVSCVDFTATLKRHNSYFFIFSVERVLSGSYQGELLRSQEIFHDFGGGQIMHKLGMAPRREKPGIECQHRAVLRIHRPSSRGWWEKVDGHHILWLAREGEEERLERLEAFGENLSRALTTADFRAIEPMLQRGSGLTPSMLGAIRSYVRAQQCVHGDVALHFSRVILESMVMERDGRVEVGGGALPYSLLLRWEAAADQKPANWVIAKASVKREELRRAFCK